MDQTEYKNRLRTFFSSLSRGDSEATKLRKIDAFRRRRGIRQHLRIFSIIAFLLFASTAPALAAPFTLIPKEVPETDETTDLTIQRNELANKFQEGNFELYDFGTYIQYLTEFLIYLAGGIAVLFIVIGGYKYIIGAATEDKEAGKKTIGYALGGFAIVVLAWTIVNFTQIFVTGG